MKWCLGHHGMKFALWYLWAAIRKLRLISFLRSKYFIRFANFIWPIYRANFIANNLRLFACFFYCNCNCNSHTNHGVVTCTDQAHHLYVKLSYEEAFPINILGDEHIIQMYSCTHYRSNHIKSQASSNNFESSFYQIWIIFVTTLYQLQSYKRCILDM